MPDPISQTIRYDQNAIYYGYPIEDLMERAGEGIAKVLVKRYGQGKKICFVCGPGNNGGDGFAAARHLKNRAEAVVFLVGSAADIKTPAARLHWKWLKGEKRDNARAADIPDDFDVVVECLFGTGVTLPVREPYKSVIAKLNRLQGKKVTIDLPAPGFAAAHNISMMFAKAKGADVVDIGFPDSIKEKIGPGEVKILQKPKPGSHKGNNGTVLIIGGSSRYHGAPLMAAKVAGKIVDLVYFASTPQNNLLAQKLKGRLLEIIAVEEKEISKITKKADVVLIGPGLGTDKKASAFVKDFLKKYKTKKTVLDADALKVIKPRALHANCIVTPQRREFRTLFGVAGTKDSTLRMAKRYGCVVVLKGKTDYVASPAEVKLNTTGNVGMTKGGTGDVLAGLIAALAATSDNALAACAGVFINGLAGDRLYKRVGRYYAATDLITEIPRALQSCEA